MKKRLLILGIALLVAVTAFVSLYKYMQIEITPQTAIEKVKEKLDEKSIETITNFDNPKIEEVLFDTPPSIGYFGEKKDAVGKVLYKITFNTTQDGLLGPMVFYVDKSGGELIGIEYRE